MKASYKSFRSYFNYLLKSIQAAVFVLLAIAGFAALGTLVPQGNPYEFYIERFGLKIGNLVWAVGYADLYHAWWFLALFAWLISSMVVCSLAHLKNILGAVPVDKPEDLDPRRNKIFRSAMAFEAETLSEKSAKDLIERISQWLRHRFYRVSVTESSGSEYRLAAEKGRFGRFGAFTIHWGCILVLAGGVLSMLFGATHTFTLAEEETVAVPGTLFRLQLHDFSVEKYPGTDKPKEYTTRISIFGKEHGSQAGVIRINDPFLFQRFRFYQMNFRVAVQDVVVRLERLSDGHLLGDYALRVGEPRGLPEWGLEIQALGFQPDFVFHEGTGNTRSEDYENPAVHLSLSSENGLSVNKWVFPDLAGSLHGGRKGLDYKARLISYTPRYSIGLKVVRDPGRAIVFLGLLIVIIGTFLSSAVFHRRLFVRLSLKRPGVLVKLVGATGRNRIGFEKEGEGLRDFVENALRPGDR